MIWRWVQYGAVGKVSILLLLGMILNVVVAWACVCWSAPPTNAHPFEETATWRAPASATWQSTGLQRKYIGTGLTEYDTMGRDGYNLLAQQWVMEAGWPMRSLYLWRNSSVIAPSTNILALQRIRPKSWTDGLAIPWGLAGSRTRLYRYLPTQVHWLGFAMDAAFYAWVLWIAISLALVLRGRGRVRRGLCPLCAYPIGTSPKCTECGLRVRRRSAEL